MTKYNEIILSAEKEPAKDQLWLHPVGGLFELLIYNNGWEPITGMKRAKMTTGKFIKVMHNKAGNAKIDLDKDISTHPTIKSILERLEALENA